MFQALHARFADRPAGTVPALFTCVVGRKPSSAQYYVNGADEVLELCQSLRLHSTRANRNRSMGDLPRHERVWGAASKGRGGMPAERCGLDWSRASQPASFLESDFGSPTRRGD